MISLKSGESITNMQIPEVPVGKDEVSFSRHNRTILLELKKSKLNVNVLCDLITISFAMRRRDILNNSYDLDAIFERYPFLQNLEQVRL